MSHPVECPVDLWLSGVPFFGKMKSVIIIFKRVNHEKAPAWCEAGTGGFAR